MNSSWWRWPLPQWKGVIRMRQWYRWPKTVPSSWAMFRHRKYLELRIRMRVRWYAECQAWASSTINSWWFVVCRSVITMCGWTEEQCLVQRLIPGLSPSTLSQVRRLTTLPSWSRQRLNIPLITQAVSSSSTPRRFQQKTVSTSPWAETGIHLLPSRTFLTQKVPEPIS